VRIYTFNGGAEQPISDVSPAQIHPNHSQRHREEPTGGGAEEALDGFVLGPGGAEPGNGETDEESEGGAGDEEAGGVLDGVEGCPGKGEGGGKGVVLVDGLLLRWNGTICLGSVVVADADGDGGGREG